MVNISEIFLLSAKVLPDMAVARKKQAQSCAAAASAFSQQFLRQLRIV